MSYSDKPELFVFAEDGAEIEAISYVSELNKKGIKAQFSVLPTLEETKAFAQKRGVQRVETFERKEKI